MSIKTPELLAPAGNLKKLKYALAFGADAVYGGLPAYSLRAKTGFNMASLKKGIEYAHKLNKKVYVTINIFTHNAQIKKLPQYLSALSAQGGNPDAIILSDPGILMLVKKYLPMMPIHLSTQANTLNIEAVRFWQKQGVRRIILGREATLKDIREIHKAVPKMELEVFVHGAMCMSYSGRCYLSAWLNNRSANQGLCTQPCRWEYQVYLEESSRPGKFMPIEEDNKGTYIMNSKDLCLIDYLDDLKKAGVSSFKIEGRTKSIYYLAVVVRAYCHALAPPARGGAIRRTEGVGVRGFKKYNTSPQPSSFRSFGGQADKGRESWDKELSKIDNRGYTTGFLFGESSEMQNFKTSKASSNWEFVGAVTKTQKTQKHENKIFVEVHNILKSGDKVEVVTPDKVHKIKIKQLFDKKGKKTAQAHGGTGEIFSFEVKGDYNIKKYSVLRKKIQNKK